MKCKRYFLLFLLLLSLAACSDNESVDPLLNFEGEYKMETFQFRYLEEYEGKVVNDTILSIKNNPHVIVKKANGYTDKMEMNVEEFAEELVFSLFSTFGFNGIVTADYEHPRLIAIDGNDFVLDGAVLNVKLKNADAEVPFRTEINAAGNLSENKISFDFKMLIAGSDDATITGTVSGTAI